MLINQKKKKEAIVTIMVGEHLESLLLQEGDTHSITPKNVEPLLIPRTCEDIVVCDGEE
jgi:hypothetical protein